MLKKKGKSFGKTVIVVTSILVLSMTGVSYAYWSDSLTINTTIKVGSMKPVFCGDETRTIELFNNNGNNKVKIGEITITPNGNTLDINGKILSDSRVKEEHIGFCIRNDGIVPIRVSEGESGNDKKIEASSNHLSASVSLKNSYIDINETYSPNEGSDGNPKIKLDFDASGLTEETSESENITLTIPFTQWIVGEAGNDGHYGSWEKSLTINITIAVVNSWNETGSRFFIEQLNKENLNGLDELNKPAEANETDGKTDGTDQTDVPEPMDIPEGNGTEATGDEQMNLHDNTRSGEAAEIKESTQNEQEEPPKEPVQNTPIEQTIEEQKPKDDKSSGAIESTPSEPSEPVYDEPQVNVEDENNAAN